MSFRWKLLIILLLISLVPLLLLTALSQRATERLGTDIGGQARRALTKRAERQLALLVKQQAALVGREGKIVELALQIQAQQAERCLASPEPEKGQAFDSEDFDAGRVPFEMTTSPRYRRLMPDGGWNRIPFTTQAQVLKYLPGRNREEDTVEAACLSAMTPTYQQLFEDQPDLFYWLYTSLETGLHSCFPGHGGYPADYDPRQRDWYKNAKERDRLVWSLPYIDVSSGRSVLTAAMPIHSPDGSFLGATGIDLFLTTIFDREKLPEEATAYLVVPAPHYLTVEQLQKPETWQDKEMDQPGLLIIARSDDEHKPTSQPSSYVIDWLESEDAGPFAAMFADMADGRPGIRQMRYRGESMLWAYGQLWQKRGYYVVTVPLRTVTAEAARAEQTVLDLTTWQLKVRAVVILILVVVVVIVALLGSRAVTRPIRQLADAAGRIAAGRFDTRVDIRSRDELGQLGNQFNAMVPQLQDRIKLRQSLDLAMEVQQHLLPSGPPQIEGLDIAGRSIYCDETGGDYYDFLDLSELTPDELGIAVGDVTGHGVAAALLMTAARSLLRSQAGQAGTLAELMAKINRHLTEDTPAGRFMTLFYLLIDVRRLTLRWANAGHDPAMVYDPKTDTFDDLAGGGIPLGIEADWTFEEFHRDQLIPGQVILIGTDGIWEARNGAGEMFGKDALRQVVRDHAHASAEQISRAVTDALAGFCGDHPQEDDITLVVVKVQA